MKKTAFAVVMLLMLAGTSSAEVTGTWKCPEGQWIFEAEINSDGHVYDRGNDVALWNLRDRVFMIIPLPPASAQDFSLGVVSDDERMIFFSDRTCLKVNP